MLAPYCQLGQLAIATLLREIVLQSIFLSEAQPKVIRDNAPIPFMFFSFSHDIMI